LSEHFFFTVMCFPKVSLFWICWGNDSWRSPLFSCSSVYFSTSPAIMWHGEKTLLCITHPAVFNIHYAPSIISHRQ